VDNSTRHGGRDSSGAGSGTLAPSIPCICKCGSAEVRKFNADNHLARSEVRKPVRKCGSVRGPTVRLSASASETSPRLPTVRRQASTGRPFTRPLQVHQTRTAGLWTSQRTRAGRHSSGLWHRPEFTRVHCANLPTLYGGPRVHSGDSRGLSAPREGSPATAPHRGPAFRCPPVQARRRAQSPVSSRIEDLMTYTDSLPTPRTDRRQA
jgi:hypothetical protein